MYNIIVSTTNNITPVKYLCSPKTTIRYIAERKYTRLKIIVVFL